ncbi:MAG: AAA family ATPase, partial [Thermodesulfobacteriota bacterium]
MSYYTLLNLEREPFSNSPDPGFFFQSTGHRRCLREVELAVLQRRGLVIVLGEVGTGKTTVCRQLIRRLAEAEPGAVEVCLVLDPDFVSARDFLVAVCGILGLPAPGEEVSERAIKEGIKGHLFRVGVEQGRTVALLFDEGQKLAGFCLEILRELLNYETNEHKLLQIVIFAQPELLAVVRERESFADRVAVLIRLGPLSLAETRRMIRFRLEQAGAAGRGLALFSWPALLAIHLTTGGYPRRIVMLASRILMAIIVGNRRRAGAWLVLRCARQQAGRALARPFAAWILLGLLAVRLGGGVWLVG